MCFYTERNYRGTELCAKEGERIDVYRAYLYLNDKFESVKVATNRSASSSVAILMMVSMVKATNINAILATWEYSPIRSAHSLFSLPKSVSTLPFSLVGLSSALVFRT